MNVKQWFAVKVKFSKMDEEKGEMKRFSEVILVDAISHGDAEEKVVAEMEQTHKELVVITVSPKSYEKVVGIEEGNMTGKFFELSAKSQDPESEKVKFINSKFLVASETALDSIGTLFEDVRGGVLDYEITSLSASPIVQVLTNN